jgi:hypothetical protein
MYHTEKWAHLEQWGQSCWIWLHTIVSVNYDGPNGFVSNDSTIGPIFADLTEFLPCCVCRDHLLRYIENNGRDLGCTWEQWAIGLHNAINSYKGYTSRNGITHKEIWWTIQESRDIHDPRTWLETASSMWMFLWVAITAITIPDDPNDCSNLLGRVERFIHRCMRTCYDRRMLDDVEIVLRLPSVDIVNIAYHQIPKTDSFENGRSTWCLAAKHRLLYWFHVVFEHIRVASPRFDHAQIECVPYGGLYEVLQSVTGNEIANMIISTENLWRTCI